jgi:hypothetical protein
MPCGALPRLLGARGAMPIRSRQFRAGSFQSSTRLHRRQHALCPLSSSGRARRKIDGIIRTIACASVASRRRDVDGMLCGQGLPALPYGQNGDLAFRACREVPSEPGSIAAEQPIKADVIFFCEAKEVTPSLWSAGLPFAVGSERQTPRRSRLLLG